MVTTTSRSPLSSEQIEQFVRDGFVLVNGLIPSQLVEEMRDTLLDDHKRATEAGASDELARFTRLVELTAPCRTEAMEAAVEQLVGPHFLRGVTYSPFLEARGADPTNLYPGFIPVLRDPQPGPREFVPPEHYHIDGAHPVSVLPDTLCMVIFVYLTDVATYGGATVVRPGSHRQVYDYWRTHEGSDTNVLPEIPYAAPMPVSGRAGDTILMHYLLVHSGSTNRSDIVRVGLNTSVVPDPAHPYAPRTGAPASDWTPLDRTLCLATA